MKRVILSEAKDLFWRRATAYSASILKSSPSSFTSSA